MSIRLLNLAAEGIDGFVTEAVAAAATAAAGLRHVVLLAFAFSKV